MWGYVILAQLSQTSLTKPIWRKYLWNCQPHTFSKWTLSKPNLHVQTQKISSHTAFSNSVHLSCWGPAGMTLPLVHTVTSLWWWAMPMSQNCENTCGTTSRTKFVDTTIWDPDYGLKHSFKAIWKRCIVVKYMLKEYVKFELNLNLKIFGLWARASKIWCQNDQSPLKKWKTLNKQLNILKIILSGINLLHWSCQMDVQRICKCGKYRPLLSTRLTHVQSCQWLPIAFLYMLYSAYTLPFKFLFASFTLCSIWGLYRLIFLLSNLHFELSWPSWIPLLVDFIMSPSQVRHTSKSQCMHLDH